ncbi:MAG: hypothetical protein KA748_11370 [Halomonas sp.]|nr:hypothetical protein [Halomonas sp.]MBP5980795.1 hypothetical protein [Halomonas sp.]
MAVYGGIQAHELERWLNALTNAAYDRRCPLSKVHGGNARARTARQDLLHLVCTFRNGERSREVAADGLGRWCQRYLTEAEWYVLVGSGAKAGTQNRIAAPSPASLEEADGALEILMQHRVG